MAGKRELKVEILGDASSATRAFGQLDNSTHGLGDKLMRIGKAVALAVGTATVAAGAGIIKVGKDYQDSLNIFRSVSQATAGQMDQVRAMAKALGSDMSLPATSAADAAKAMTALVKAGLNVNETMAASKGVLQLAAAAGVDEAVAAEIAANALNAFSLKGSEANRVADLLAAAANSSSGEITDMADALQMSSAVFAAAGVPIEDLTASIAMMANKGIIGSDAGTSLKSMMLALQTPSEKAARTLDELGISVYDADGKMRSMRDLIGMFTKKMGTLTQEQRESALGTIFGSDAIRSANVVMLGGVEAFDKMKESVSRQGAAADVSAARMKGLSGAWQGFLSQLETIAIVIYEKVSPALEGMLRGLAGALPGALKALGDWWKDNGPAITAFAIAIGNAIGDFAVAAFNTFADWWKNNGPGITKFLTRLGTVVSVVLVGAFKLLKGWWDKHGQTVTDVISAFASTISAAFEALVDAAEFVVRNWDKIGPVLKTAAVLVATVMIPHWISLGVAAVSSAATQVAAWISTKVATLSAAVVHSFQIVMMIAKWIALGLAAIAQAAVIAGAWVIAKAGAVGAAVVMAAQVALQVAGWALLGVQSMIHAAKIAAAWVIALGPVAWVIAGIVAVGATLILAYQKVEWFRDAVNAAFHWISATVGTVVGWIRQNWDLLLAILTGPIGIAVSVWRRFGDDIKEFIRTAVQYIKDRFANFIDFVTNLPGRIATAGRGMFDIFKESFKTAINWIIDAWNQLEFKIPGVDPPGPGPTLPGFTLGTPTIPRLAEGGRITAPGVSWVGENGPELLHLPRGAEVEPLTGTSSSNITVIAQTNADAYDISREIAWQLKTA